MEREEAEEVKSKKRLGAGKGEQRGNPMD